MVKCCANGDDRLECLQIECLQNKENAIEAINKFYISCKKFGVDVDALETEMMEIIEVGTNNEVGLSR